VRSSGGVKCGGGASRGAGGGMHDDDGGASRGRRRCSLCTTTTRSMMAVHLCDGGASRGLRRCLLPPFRATARRPPSRQWTCQIRRRSLNCIIRSSQIGHGGAGGCGPVACSGLVVVTCASMVVVAARWRATGGLGMALAMSTEVRRQRATTAGRWARGAGFCFFLFFLTKLC
jgi:hypothetical protein